VESSPVRSGCVIALSHLGGAISRVKPTATAFWNRDAERNLIVNVSWEEAAAGERNVQWLREGWKAFEPLCTGFYVNDAATDETERRIRTTYGANYARLAALKGKYDPMNLFRMNANIKPAA
jgi:Berberine and berberine like